MHIIQRYLYREIGITFLAVMAVLLLLFGSKHFVRYMTAAAAGELATELILTILGFFLLASLVLIIPFALYLAILLGLGRLYKDSEITAMEACGISAPLLMRYVLYIALVVAFVVALLSLWVKPMAEQRHFDIKKEAQKESEFGLLEPGRFHEIRDGKGVFYVESFEGSPRKMRNVFVYLNQGDVLEVFSARSGFVQPALSDGSRFMVLEQGNRVQINQKNGHFTTIDYQRTGIRLTPVSLARFRPVYAYSTTELWQSEELSHRAELQWRLSMPVVCVLLALLAVPMSKTKPRQGRFAKLGSSLVLLVVYYYLLMISKTWVVQGVVSPTLGLWWVHVVFAVLLWAFTAQAFGRYGKSKPVRSNESAA